MYHIFVDVQYMMIMVNIGLIFVNVQSNIQVIIIVNDILFNVYSYDDYG